MNKSVREGHGIVVIVMLALFALGCLFQAFIA